MSDINHILDKDPLDLSAQDINDTIAYYRNMRARVTAGKKVVKEKGPTVKLDITALGLAHKVERPTVKRRV